MEYNTADLSAGLDNVEDLITLLEDNSEVDVINEAIGALDWLTLQEQAFRPPDYLEEEGLDWDQPAPDLGLFYAHGQVREMIERLAYVLYESVHRMSAPDWVVGRVKRRVFAMLERLHLQMLDVEGK